MNGGADFTERDWLVCALGLWCESLERSIVASKLVE
jgi:hypothetical protein